MVHYRIGVDVGGTNTDAVVLRPLVDDDLNTRDDPVVAWAKTVTTPDVTSGIEEALKNVLRNGKISPKDVHFVSIGTTHFLNAVIEGDAKRLSRVAVIRLAGPYTKKCPPFINFPPRLRDVIMGYIRIIDGGLEIDGKEICPINDDQLRQCCQEIREKSIKDIVLVGLFSPLGNQEEYAREFILNILGPENINVVCSRDVANIGLLERENAAILNASILRFAKRTIRSYKIALKNLGLACPLFLTQLDGTLIDASAASRVPIRTFSNGPTNSMRGAAFLSGIDRQLRERSTIVVDVGGTSTDVGVLLPSGFPRTAAAFTEVGGVRTNFTMPDIHSIGLGGGSRVRFDSNAGASLVSVGPDSVGYEITSRSIIFGGSELTATDLVVAFGAVQGIGDSSLAINALTSSQIASGQTTIRRLLESAIDKMKTDSDDVDVLLVGGGSIIVSQNLRGVRRIYRPPHFEVANAVGAAIARVSGNVDRVEVPVPGKRDMEQIVGECKGEAVELAVKAGARSESVSVVEVDVMQLPYVANAASRVIVRAVGDLDVDNIEINAIMSDEHDYAEGDEEIDRSENVQSPLVVETFNSTLDIVDLSSYRPSVSSDGVWTLSETDIEWITEGCGILGCGGGGATYPSYLMARQALRDGHHIRVVDKDYAKFLENKDAYILPCGFMGSPSVSSERIPSGEEIPAATKCLMEYLNAGEPAAIISGEIGGLNGIEPLLLTTQPGFNLPVVDGDLMGRAYPWLHQLTPCLFKSNGLTPAAGADGIGNCILVPSTRDNATVEEIFRVACTALGSSLAVTYAALRARELDKLAICGSISLAWRIGRAVASCRWAKNLARISDAITEVQGGKCLFVGKIVDVTREVKGGFTHGRITIIPLSQDEVEPSSRTASQPVNLPSEGTLTIPFQNENLAAYRENSDGSKHVVCTVPDLIAVLDSQSGSSIGTQDYRYGLRVTVIGLACDPCWTTERGLEVGGPVAFGMPNNYSPIGKYRPPTSVIQEFRPL